VSQQPLFLVCYLVCQVFLKTPLMVIAIVLVRKLYIEGTLEKHEAEA